MFGRFLNIAKVASAAFAGVSVARCNAAPAHHPESPAWSRALPQWICLSQHPMFFEVVKQVVPGSVTTVHTKGWRPQLDPFCIRQARSQIITSSFDTSAYHGLPLLASVTYKSSFVDLQNTIHYSYTGSLQYKDIFYKYNTTITNALVFINDEEERMTDEYIQKLAEMCEDAKTYNVSLSFVILVP